MESGFWLIRGNTHLHSAQDGRLLHTRLHRFGGWEVVVDPVMALISRGLDGMGPLSTFHSLGVF